MNQLRIIAGQWRGRKIDFADHKFLRPSPDRVRETLFNWLQNSIHGAHCLDLFSGSGALAFEAASRGAKTVTCLETQREAAMFIQKNIDRLQAKQITLLQTDAIRYLQTAAPEHTYDLVFLDPPFSGDFMATACSLLETRYWLSQSADIYLESNQALDTFALPENWILKKQKKAGQVYYGLFARSEPAKAAENSDSGSV